MAALTFHFHGDNLHNIHCIDVFVYRNRTQGPITRGVTSLDRFLQFTINEKCLLQISCKVETWYTHGQWAVAWCILESGPRTYNSWISFDRFYNLPLLKNFLHTFLKNYKGYKIETWYTYAWWVDVLCIPESGPRAHNFWS